jgi:ribonuclease HI
MKLFVDGAARGNPGPAGIGVVLLDTEGALLEELSEPIGEATNNVAEYAALIRGLEKALAYRPDRLIVHSDSELMTRQVQGVYQVKSERLLDSHRRAMELLIRFPSYEMIHVPRSLNSRADHLAASAAKGVKPNP